MRALLALLCLMLLAGCSGDPRSFGITGPGTQPPPAVAPMDEPDTGPTPGVSTSGTSYGPSNRPTSGGSGFFGYN